MRVLIYGDIGGSGGYVRYCKGLLGSKCIPKNLKVWFISSSPFYEELAPLDPEIKVISHPWINSTNRIYRYLWHLWKYPRLVKKINPDIEFYPSGQLRVYLRKALTVSTCHNLLLFDKYELKQIEDVNLQEFFQVYRKNQENSYIKSNSVIFLSKHSQKVVTKEVKGIKDKTVISHGLDPMFLLPKKSTYEFGNKINLLYVSPIYSYKHQIEVVQAVKLIRDSSGLNISIKLIGGGDPKTIRQLKQFLQSEKLEKFAHLVGEVDYTKLIKEYSFADIFIFASSCETFGITILEAMGARLPIACSNRTGLSEILKDAGVYFNPEDPQSIASSINELIKDIKLREILGERAYYYALDYTWEHCAAETFKHIIKIGKNK